MTDAERETHIKDCGELMRRSYVEGDHAGAREWQSRMYQAIRMRSEAQQLAMTGRIDAAIAEDGGCYFATMGEIHGALGRPAHA